MRNTEINIGIYNTAKASKIKSIVAKSTQLDATVRTRASGKVSEEVHIVANNRKTTETELVFKFLKAVLNSL